MMNFGSFFVICWLFWNSLRVSARTTRDHQLDYIPLRRTEIIVPDVTAVCSSLYRDVFHIWVNRRKIRKEFRTAVSRWTRDSNAGGSKKNSLLAPFGLASRKYKTNILLHRTASVAGQVASAALRVSPQDTCESEDCTNAEFEAFQSLNRVSTTLVSQNFSENSVLLAKLKTMKVRGINQQLRVSKKEEPKEDINGLSIRDLQCLADPLIPQSVWDRLTGREFTQHTELLDGLSKTGFKLASNDQSNQWVVWNKVASSFKEPLEDGAIRVWTGQAVVRNSDEKKYYGASAPFIKTRSIIPMSPSELIELMLDSSRVQTYNKWSIGRIDLWKSPDERTKIVQNTNQVPMGKRPLRSTTLLHACPIRTNDKPVDETTSWLLLSRAIGPQPVDESIGTSDILLGVNLIQPCGDGESSVLTAVTHVYSTAVPGMLAERLGVQSAIKFVKDLRALVVPVSG